jgi:hypothetical protein
MKIMSKQELNKLALLSGKLREDHIKVGIKQAGTLVW